MMSEMVKIGKSEILRVLNSQTSRRGFIKTLTLVSTALTLGSLVSDCAGNLRRRLFTDINPNLRFPHSGGYFPTFRSMINSFNGSTPGIDYSVRPGETIVASAPGRVIDVHELRSDPRMGGYMVTILHPGDYRSPYRTFYAHLDKEGLADIGPIQRGQPIGKMTFYPDHTKIMFRIGTDWANADRYGPGMGFQVYPEDYDSSNDPSLETLTNKKKLGDWYREMWQLDRNQQDAINAIEQHRVGYPKVRLRDTFHVKGGNRQCRWSLAEIMQFMADEYNADPTRYPDLAKDEIDASISHFYKNQPIVLTLPMHKPA
jgi:hypothetical protein